MSVQYCEADFCNPEVSSQLEKPLLIKLFDCNRTLPWPCRQRVIELFRLTIKRPNCVFEVIHGSNFDELSRRGSLLPNDEKGE